MILEEVNVLAYLETQHFMFCRFTFFCHKYNEKIILTNVRPEKVYHNVLREGQTEYKAVLAINQMFLL